MHWILIYFVTLKSNRVNSSESVNHGICLHSSDALLLISEKVLDSLGQRVKILVRMSQSKSK